MANDLSALWRSLRLAVKQAHALGVEFYVRGADIESVGIECLPDKLRNALDHDMLREYFGASEDDDEAIDFLNNLGVDAVLVTNATAAMEAVVELESEKAPFIGLDIETIGKPEYTQRQTVKVNVDGSIGKTPKDPRDKTRRPPGTDPHQADIATLQLYAGGKRCFVFHGAALDWILLSSPWLPEQTFIAHNATFELAFLQHRGIHLNIGCTMQAGGIVVGVGFGGEKRSLANVSKEILGLDPPKSLQMSDWGAARLSPGQVCYAATDAILAYRLWPKLRAQIITKERTGAYLLQR